MELGGAEFGTLEVSNFMKKMGWKVIVASSGGSLVRNLILESLKLANDQENIKEEFDDIINKLFIEFSILLNSFLNIY